MISIGRIIIDKELPVGIVLDSIRDNLCCWIIARNHPSRSVNYGTREGKPMHCVTIRCLQIAFDSFLPLRYDETDIFDNIQ